MAGNVAAQSGSGHTGPSHATAAAAGGMARSRSSRHRSAATSSSCSGFFILRSLGALIRPTSPSYMRSLNGLLVYDKESE